MEGSYSSEASDVDDASSTLPAVQDSSDVVCEEAVGESAEVLGRGVSSVLENLISVFLDRAEGVGQSQAQLSNGIDRLTRVNTKTLEELDQLLEDAPMPFIMQRASKISGLCKRVSSLNTILKSIQWRIDNIDWLLSMGSSQGIDA
ncbi:unnamed protein product [Victoria cruziana]